LQLPAKVRFQRIRATRTGGYADVELVFDGKTATVLGKNVNAFAQTDAPGSVDQLIDRLRDQYNVAMPGADLLLSRVYDELMADVIDAKHIGQGVIDGVECEHLVNADADWQLWVEIGARPIPRKYVITSKAVTRRAAIHAAHQGLANGRTGGCGCLCIQTAALRKIDEVPPGQPSAQATGGKR
jgi:hypothetical protein